MERLQLQQQQQNQQQPGENTLFEEENDDDVGDNEDGPDDLPGSGESWDDRAGVESSKNQSAPRSSSSRSSQSHIGSVVQAHRTPASGSASAPPPTPVAPIPTMVPSLSLFRLPSGNSLTPSTGSRLTAGSESAPQTTNATPISEHPPHLSLASAAAMTFTLPDVSVPPDAAVRASNELPGMDDFMEWMDSVDTNELNHMLLPHPNILTPPAEDPIQLETLFHKFWPLLHLPTFSMDMATPALTHALGHIKDWVQQKAVSDAIVWDVNSNIKLLPNFMQSISGDINLSSSSRTMSIGTLQFVQALGLIAACAITGNSPPAIFEWATLCSDMCTAYLRHMGVYQGTRKIEQPFHIADERWIMEEQFNRLAATFLRFDAYLGLILDRAPTLRWPEMRFIFPASEAIWRAVTPEDRRVLLWHEPAGRYSTSVRTIIRDGLMQAGLIDLPRPKLLLMEDYNLALCAFLSDVWDVTQEARHHDHRSYKSPSKDAAEGTATWKAYLLDLRGHMEMNYNLEESFFKPDCNLPSSPPQSAFPLASPPPIGNNTESVLAISTAAINLTIYHLLQLMMLADIPVLETSKCCEDCQDLGLSMRMRQWASGPDGRRAVVHAAQLRRIHGRATCTVGYTTCLTAAQRRISNPLQAAGLFYSAIVLCSFAHRADCAHDAGGLGPQHQGEIVELVHPEVGGHVCENLEGWIRDGPGPGAGASLLGVPLCRCSVPSLAAWYRDQLGSGSLFTQRLLKFETTLQR
ncbi:hypothetical protein VP1G_09086 [Cytospora mali]|uniref:Transcription factor domain-containing protein n=1 Tax=Cytospora mali TaxID=578113 RepID=A0A194VD63_CYTMA|nr:hypothetical protein VP1G_09086 [Valsa mali var. pyri (nom. inval.)]